ncbi:hypothetical protein BH10PLA2_BH10PLA2_39240 [soil metagenome]
MLPFSDCSKWMVCSRILIAANTVREAEKAELKGLLPTSSYLIGQLSRFLIAGVATLL